MGIMEIVHFSERDGEQKVVQLYLKNGSAQTPVLITDDSSVLHCRILENFLVERRIAYDKITKKDEDFTYFIPDISGSGYKVVGMGYAQLYFSDKQFSGMGGRSKDYNMRIDEEHKRLVIATLKERGWIIL